MTQNNKKYQRKKYYINKEFQLQFIIRFCLLLLAGVVFSTVLLYLFSQDTLTSSFHQSRLVIENTGLAILPSIIYTNLITLALITVATIFVTLFISHKVFGPLVRLNTELNIVGKGDLTRKVVLRDKDQLTEIAENMNAMITNLNSKVSSIHSEIAKIQHESDHESLPEELEKKIFQIEQFIKSNFKL